MHTTKFIICALFITNLAMADDTEIYGTSEIDEDNRVNSNVLFIMDTSGSMGGEVKVTQKPYDTHQSYSGSYYTDDIYNSLNDGKKDGHKRSAFTHSESYDCDTTLTEIDKIGRVLGEFYQNKNGWKKLKDGSDNTIRCDSGETLWLYSGNYLNWHHDKDNTTTSTRMEVVVDVVKDLTHSLNNINFGLMRFDQYSNGGMIDVPIEDIATSGEKIRNKLDSYYPYGGTPLEESMYEATLYYRGDKMDYGDNSYPNQSHADARVSPTSNTYLSPVDATCQKNHIILLTDGEPTNDTGANKEIKDYIADSLLPSGLSKSCSGDGECMDELAYWLNNTDQSSSFVGKQAVTTYTIGGFGLDEGVDLLKRTAHFGGGKYFEANDTSELAAALESIFMDILATDSTFTAPSVSVNSFKSSEHTEQLYYALFRPSENIQWGGNLKKYRLDDDGQIVDANGAIAINDDTGFFNDDTFDYWNQSAIADGDDVTLGGFANLLQAQNRRLFSDTSFGSLASFASASSRETFSMEGYSLDEFINVQNWAIGFDVDDTDADNDTTDSRHSIGDPLHSEPLVITYGGNAEKRDASIFFGTNEGFIHALDADTGEEEFAFIPTSLHSNLIEYYNNTTAAKDKPYGMDGAITSWMYDVNNNNVILNSSGNVEPGEHVYIYTGMRRGGRNYYGLDVTNRDNPKLLFKIEGGAGDFEKLGQSWARATVAKVKYNGESRFVLLFSGGYDTNQDGNDTKEADTFGNAVYMVDATTGKRLWWASNSGANENISEMTNSMPASISAIDITGDGHINYFYAADMGGRVFRFDINNNNKGIDFAQGGMIASLAGSDKSNNRRFYNKPNVALVKDKQLGDYLTIAIGSGHRAHPIFTTEVENRFYVIKDFFPYGKPASYQVTSEAAQNKISLNPGEYANANLVYNATNMMKGAEASADMKSIMAHGGGWYITLDTPGEKILAHSTTSAGAILFTSFSPTGNASANCGPDTGMSSLYALDQTSATAVMDLDGDGDIDSDDAKSNLAHSGIAPTPVIIYRKNGEKTIAIGTETRSDSRFEQSEPCEEGKECVNVPSDCDVNNCYVTPVYWRENDTP